MAKVSKFGNCGDSFQLQRIETSSCDHLQSRQGIIEVVFLPLRDMPFQFTYVEEMAKDQETPNLQIASSLDEPLTGNLIVFDADCILCSGFARFMARHDRQAGFRFVNAHSYKGQELYRRLGLDPDLMETNIVIYNGWAFTKMASLTTAMKSLGWPWRIISLLDALPATLSDWLYDRVAQNRYRFGRRSCPLPSQELRGRIVD